MNSPTDTDYIDAKAEAIAATLALDAKEYQAKTNIRLDAINHRLDAIEQSMQSGFKSLREELAAQLAQFEVRILHAQAESFKWIIGAVIGGIAISTSISAVLINSTSAKAPTPIVIYTQPSPK